MYRAANLDVHVAVVPLQQDRVVRHHVRVFNAADTATGLDMLVVRCAIEPLNRSAPVPWVATLGIVHRVFPQSFWVTPAVASALKAAVRATMVSRPLGGF